MERQNEIYEILKQKKSISVDKLTKLLYVSQSTIRRDLTEMEKQGLVKRTYGGVVLQESPNEETSLLLRETINVREKKKIAEIASRLLKDNLSVFIDSSSTCTYLVPYMKNFKNLNIVTNGLRIGLLLSEQTSCQIFLASGYIHSRSNSILGNLTVKTLERLHCDLSIISCSGLDLGFGLSETTIDQSEVKIAMAENSNRIILLADHSKFDDAKLFKSIPLSKIDCIVTDQRPSEEYVEFCANNGIELLYQ
ncbi:MAG TPA: DeoR/GlpR transcriptional regulator [Candidatus Enteromonas pullicola]|uniref:Lactose phosphotransferase system repressor n=1 Tax=Candidatus Alloenteromonas pullicola TaxID=2840784 RepID=A0A9D1LNK2_9FIRM|nr:DeoR/GlpR transcriptional regulator [Candidatus Enteromonas pullicola]